MFSTCIIIEFKGHEIGIHRALTPLFGNGAGALGIGKLAAFRLKLGKSILFICMKFLLLD